MTEACKQTRPRIGEGVYTIPDVAGILDLPVDKARRWVSGYWRTACGVSKHHGGILDCGCWGEGLERGVNFLAMIELYTFAALRERGLSGQRIKKAREELARRFETPYPFASHKLLSDGRRVIVVLNEQVGERWMILGESGQIALREIMEPFCHKIEFCDTTDLARAYWPLGRDRLVVVNPSHSFGRPTIKDTNITTQAIAQLARAGESHRAIADMYEIPLRAIRDALAFEFPDAA